MEVRAVTSGELALTADEVSLLLAGVKDLRDECLLCLAIETGMRREDLVGVKRQDVDVEGGWVVFYEHKKRRVWRSWFGARSAKLIAQYLREAPKSEWLFPSAWKGKGHLSSRAAYDVLQRWLKAVGLASRPFHALRATMIKLARRRGWTPSDVMLQTGDSYRTIMLHYDTPSRDEMAQLVREKPIL
jgi:integrase